MDIFCGHFLWTLFVDIFKELFVDPFCIHFLLTFRKNAYFLLPFLSVLVLMLLYASVERFCVSCTRVFHSGHRNWTLHHLLIWNVPSSYSYKLAHLFNWMIFFCDHMRYHEILPKIIFLYFSEFIYVQCVVSNTLKFFFGGALPLKYWLMLHIWKQNVLLRVHVNLVYKKMDA